ncbi:hypothetical protein, partial [Phocaeicola vulgatus]|uniref:hypothetical protein n=1 Tax=Phocaeicola vulgatus TaxID=821 RepID=UPI0039B4ACC8
YINPKIFVRSEDRDFNYEPIFDCLLFLRFRTNVFLIQKIVHNYIQKDILIVTTNTFRLPNRVISFQL